MVRGMADHTLWDKEFRLVVDIIFLFFLLLRKASFSLKKFFFLSFRISEKYSYQNYASRYLFMFSYFYANWALCRSNGDQIIQKLTFI